MLFDSSTGCIAGDWEVFFRSFICWIVNAVMIPRSVGQRA